MATLSSETAFNFEYIAQSESNCEIQASVLLVESKKNWNDLRTGGLIIQVRIGGHMFKSITTNAIVAVAAAALAATVTIFVATGAIPEANAHPQNLAFPVQAQDPA